MRRSVVLVRWIATRKGAGFDADIGFYFISVLGLSQTELGRAMDIE